MNLGDGTILAIFGGQQANALRFISVLTILTSLIGIRGKIVNDKFAPLDGLYIGLWNLLFKVGVIRPHK